MKILFYLLLCCNLAFANIQNLFESIVQINANNNSKSAKELIEDSQKKLEIMQTILNEIKQEKIKPRDYTNIINNIQSEITINNDVENKYITTLQQIKLNTILAHKILEESIYKIQQSNTILQNKKELNQNIESYIKQLESLQNIKLDNSTKDLEGNLKELSSIISSSKEILRYLELNSNELLDNSIASKISLSHILKLIETKLSDINIPNSQIASKIFLSFFVFAILFLMKNTIANTIVKAISLISSFLKSDSVQCRIKAQINKPIVTIILILSMHISINILLYPNTIEDKYNTWFNLIYILSTSWFFILLFKGYIIEILGDMIERQSNIRKEVMNLILKTMYFIIFIITLLVILKNFGFNISTVVASLGIGGIAVALAIKDTLANFFASVIVLIDNSFNQGDWIACGDIEGTVVEMGLRRTTIRTYDNALLFVPNSILANTSIKNWNRRKSGRIIRMTIGVTYSATKEQLENCIKDIKEMLLNNPKIAKDTDERDEMELQSVLLRKNIISSDDLLGYKNTLFVAFDGFGDSSLNILVYCFSTATKWSEWMETKEEICYEILKIVEKHNLSFAFPSQSLYIESIPNNK